MTGWFSANGLVLNVEKTNIMKFTPNNRQNETFQILHQNRLLIGTDNTKFLGLELDKNVNWKNHIQKILPKLSSACYLIRRMCPSCNINTLKMIYFAYFHSVMEFGIIFWGVSVESKKECFVWRLLPPRRPVTELDLHHRKSSNTCFNYCTYVHQFKIPYTRSRCIGQLTIIQFILLVPYLYAWWGLSWAETCSSLLTVTQNKIINILFYFVCVFDG